MLNPAMHRLSVSVDNNFILCIGILCCVRTVHKNAIIINIFVVSFIAEHSSGALAAFQTTNCARSDIELYILHVPKNNILT